MRKRCVLLAATVLMIASSARATVPLEFSVQGVLRDSGGALQSTMLPIKVRFFDASTAGNKYGSDYDLGTMVPVVDGLFTATIQAPSLLTDLASAGAVWLEVEVNSEIYPRQLVTPEIYSLMSSQADNAAQLGGVAATGYVLKTDVIGSSNGGTGIATAPGDGKFLRSSAGVWTVGTIGASDVPNNFPGAVSFSLQSTVGGATSLSVGDPSVNFNPLKAGVPNGVISFPGTGWRTGFLVYYPHPYGGGSSEFQFTGCTNCTTWSDPVDLAVTGMSTSGSDARLKKDIKPLENALAAIEKLHGVRFRWKSGGDASVGLIAQDVERVFPELVRKDARGYLSVAYGNLVGVVIEALKQSRSEQAEEMRALKAENAVLQARLGRLESRLEQLSTAPGKPHKLAQAER